MKITTNRTRYSTEDLQAIADLMVSLPERSGFKTSLAGSKERRELEVNYWKGKHDESRGGWSKEKENGIGFGPWFTNKAGAYQASERLLILPWSKVLEALSPMDALALAGTEEPVLPREAVAQVAVHIGLRLGYRNQARTSTVGKLARVVQGDDLLGACQVRLLPRVVDPKPKGDPAAHLKVLERTFHKGRAAQEARDVKRTMKWGVRTYQEHWAKTETQRKRLVAKGGVATPYPTIREVLQDLLDNLED